MTKQLELTAIAIDGPGAGGDCGNATFSDGKSYDFLLHKGGVEVFTIGRKIKSPKRAALISSYFAADGARQDRLAQDYVDSLVREEMAKDTTATRLKIRLRVTSRLNTCPHSCLPPRLADMLSSSLSRLMPYALAWERYRAMKAEQAAEHATREEKRLADAAAAIATWKDGESRDYVVTGTHGAPNWKAKLPLVVHVHFQPYDQKFYATGYDLGCGKSFSTPEAAVSHLATDNGYSVWSIKPVVETPTPEDIESISDIEPVESNDRDALIGEILSALENLLAAQTCGDICSNTCPVCEDARNAIAKAKRALS